MKTYPASVIESYAKRMDIPLSAAWMSYQELTGYYVPALLLDLGEDRHILRILYIRKGWR